MVGFAQKKASVCKSVDEVIKKTFDALNSRNQKQFLSLVKPDVVLEGLQIELENDTSLVEEYGPFYKHPKQILVLAKHNFGNIIKELNKVGKNKSTVLELIDYEIVYKTSDPTYRQYDIDLTVKISDIIFHFGTYVFQSGRQYSMLVPLYETEEADEFDTEL